MSECRTRTPGSFLGRPLCGFCGQFLLQKLRNACTGGLFFPENLSIFACEIFAEALSSNIRLPKAIKEVQPMDAIHVNGTTQVANPARAQQTLQSSRAELARKLNTGDHRDVPDTPENRRDVQKAIDALDMFANDKKSNTRFQYAVHDETGTIQVKLYNYLTGEVVQEIPSSKLLEFASHMQELSGLLLNEQA